MKRLKILYNYSRACQEEKTGIPFFVDELYKHLKSIEAVTVTKTACISCYIPRKYWYLYRFVEKILYHRLYLPFKMRWGGYDVYIETDYMFTPLFKPKGVFVVTLIYDIALLLFDTIQTKKFRKNWRENLAISIRNSDLLLTISKSSQRDIQEYLSKSLKVQKSVEFIYPSTILRATEVDFSEVASKFQLPKEYLLFLGTLEPRKNPLRLIEAFHLFKKKRKSEYKLVFAGKRGWLYDDVLHYIKRNSLEDEVLFLGYITQEEKSLLLKHAKAFLFLSIYEGFGMPVLEALTLNVPTLVSDIELFHELFEESVLYADPYDIEAIALKIEMILDSPPIIDKGVLEKFSWDESAKRLVNILNRYVESL